MDNRLVEIEKFSAEEVLETSLRPDVWSEYIGQEQIKKNLGVFIEASKKRN
ncbi:MAG: Holliday junction branch migration DNA helicase RuvB, partial [Thiovulaceae bacterium]|nr:Holliday junction branch migration DNA helicase RuvB [Sulfurimonadaceae bacterium]